MNTHFKAFISGFLSTLVFHQGIIALLYFSKVIPIAPYNLAPTQPLGIPSVISLAFFGGLWGIIVWKLVKNYSGSKHLVRAVVYGAIGPTALAFLVVFPIKGINAPLAMIPVGLILNGAWGAGNSLFMIIQGEKKNQLNF